MMKLGDTTVLEAIFRRLSGLRYPKWFATSAMNEDNELSDLAQDFGWSVFRGSNSNVLSRFVGILEGSDYARCIRLTGDNPFVCPWAINEMIEIFTNMNDSIDYLSDFDSCQYPTGAFGEVFSTSAFLKGISDIPPLELWHYAHVTTWLRASGRVADLHLPENYPKRPGWRWTIDHFEDLEFARRLVEILGNNWEKLSYAEIVKILDMNTELLNINSKLKQKPVELG